MNDTKLSHAPVEALKLHRAVLKGQVAPKAYLTPFM
jgi:hypothetical protein